MNDLKFSLVIPHINEGYLLNIMLDSIYNFFAYQNYEIIVVDDGSDNLSDLDFIANHFLKDKISLYFVDNLGLANVKNFGASKANGDYFIFLDSHMYFNDNFLGKLNELLQKHPEVDLLQPIIGSIADKKMLGQIYKIKNLNLDSTWDLPNSINQNDIYETPNIAGGATIVKKNVFFKIDGFNKFFVKWGCEDLDFSMRAWLWGFQAYFTAELFVAHYFKTSFTNTQVKSEQVLNNKIMFTLSCFNFEKQSEILLELLKNYGEELYNNIYGQVLNNKNFLEWKDSQKKSFIYDDKWYLSKFCNYIKR